MSEDTWKYRFLRRGDKSCTDLRREWEQHTGQTEWGWRGWGQGGRARVWELCRAQGWSKETHFCLRFYFEASPKYEQSRQQNTMCQLHLPPADGNSSSRSGAITRNSWTYEQDCGKRESLLFPGDFQEPGVLRSPGLSEQVRPHTGICTGSKGIVRTPDTGQMQSLKVWNKEGTSEGSHTATVWPAAWACGAAEGWCQRPQASVAKQTGDSLVSRGLRAAVSDLRDKAGLQPDKDSWANRVRFRQRDWKQEKHRRVSNRRQLLRLSQALLLIEGTMSVAGRAGDYSTDIITQCQSTEKPGFYCTTERHFAPFCSVGIPWWLSGKKYPPADVADMGLILGSGRSPREGNGNLLQYSCLEN